MENKPIEQRKEIVWNMYKNNPNLTQKELSKATGLTVNTVSTTLTQKLKKEKKYAFKNIPLE